MANEPDRPTTDWNRKEPQRPTIQRPNVDPPRPTIERPTIDIQQPTVQRPAPERPTITLGDTPAASPAQRPAPTPTPGKPDTGRHPGRQVSRLAHVMATHYNNFQMNKTGNEDNAILPTTAQRRIDKHRADRHKIGYDERTQKMHLQLLDSFVERHNKDYGYEDL